MAFAVYDDEDSMDRVLRTMLVRVGVDCLSTQEAGRRGSTDASQLEFAAAQGRVVITYNRRDFQRLHGAWMAAGRTHAGIIIITNQLIPRAELAARLLALWSSRTSEDMVNAILFVNRAG